MRSYIASTPRQSHASVPYATLDQSRYRKKVKLTPANAAGLLSPPEGSFRPTPRRLAIVRYARANARGETTQIAFSYYRLTAQMPRPPETPSQSPWAVKPLLGAQLRLPTSKSHRQHAAGPRACSGPEPDCWVPFMPDNAAAFPWFKRSQTSTIESSAPEARVPLLDGDHSTQFRGAACPLSSNSAWPGCRTSKIRITLES
jgi:hypothetical protein